MAMVNPSAPGANARKEKVEQLTTNVQPLRLSSPLEMLAKSRARMAASCSQDSTVLIKREGHLSTLAEVKVQKSHLNLTPTKHAYSSVTTGPHLSIPNVGDP